ncbi:uncharacterized protein BDR25DRAFT_310763 [Lindgomyces ingoldianus]|uniref:Uncharacterized protein n=1 Tax=Lindgomyces ingoldianus TaxID=673940 RepID=A0ACB6R9G1_9PLEO|nr:uncharacterized protein BDR25DRAFT_310763 [Lindgomyces ingoldianus]KAF2475375.1 hypothetical protein BDR25DRAFT_310763 [Lindgomyces ingoldianus]
MVAVISMAPEYETNSELWGIAFGGQYYPTADNFDVATNDANQALSLYPIRVSQPSPRPLVNATLQCFNQSVGNLDIADTQEADQNSCQHHVSTFPPSSRLSANAVSQYPGPGCIQASYLTLGFGEYVDYEQTDNSGGIPYNISSSSTHHSTNGPTHRWHQPTSSLVTPNLTSGYEGLSQDYLHPFNEVDPPTAIPLELTNHVE